MVNSSRIGVPWEYPRDGFSNATHSTSNTSAWAPQAPEFGSLLYRIWLLPSTASAMASGYGWKPEGSSEV